MAEKRGNNKLTRFQRKLKRAFTNPFTYIGIIIFISICIATYVVGVTETKTDSGITGWFDTIWHTIVAVSAAYFDSDGRSENYRRPPKTGEETVEQRIRQLENELAYTRQEVEFLKKLQAANMEAQKQWGCKRRQK